MRRLPDGSWTYSPKDLIAWLEGDFAAWCEREAAEHRGTGGSGAPPREPDARDDEMELAVRYGLEHEQQHLDRLRQLHPTLTEIDPKAPNAAAVTREALRRGAPVVFQAVLESGRWMGIADFLHRVEHASGLGDWAYEPWDTKLARSAKPYFLLQLCAYAEMLEATQALRPDRLGFILGDGSESHFRTDDFWHYYRRLKRQFERFQAEWDPQAMPDPGADRGHGRWTAEAERILEARDDLSLVAGISRSMIVRLREAGVETVAALGALAPGHAIPGIAPASLARVREQAAMQLETRASGAIAWRRREPDPDDPRRGLALLPPPSPLDVYYDIEGFPYAPGGLEYLHGATTVEPDGSLAFHDWWAHDEPAEKLAFEEFIDWAWARWQEDPAMHVYHYAAYERTALSRLSTKYGTREWEVDQFLRHDVLVDLLTVVRQGFVIGTPSYSLKDIEHLYMPPRDAEVSSAGASVVEYQKWIDSGEPGDWQHSAILTGLRNYNRDDCDSTAQLAAWLRERQAEAGIAWIPLVEIADATITREPTEAETVATALLEEALALPDGSDERRRAQMLGWLLEFHRRDEKPMWWRYFERLMMEEQQLVDDLDCLGGLTRTDTPARPIRKSTGLEYRFDPGQDTRLHVGSDCVVTTYPNLKVSVEALDLERGLVEVKLGPDKEIPDHLSLIPYEYLSAEVIKAAILTYVKRWREDGTVHQAVDDLLVEGIVSVVGGGLGRRADDDQDPLKVNAHRGEHRTVRFEVSQVVVLLQPGKADQLLLLRAGLDQPVDRDRVRDQYASGHLPGDLPLESGEFVVLHLGRGDEEGAGQHGEVDRAVCHRQVRPVLPDRTRQPGRSTGQGPGLAELAGAAVLADHQMRDSEPLEITDRLPVFAGGDQDLVAPLTETLDHRPEHHRVRCGSAVEPDFHPRPG